MRLHVKKIYSFRLCEDTFVSGTGVLHKDASTVHRRLRRAGGCADADAAARSIRQQ